MLDNLPRALGGLTLIALTLMALTLMALPSVSTAEQSTFDGWYQVDIIIFKPRTADLDDESWPEYTNSYPANVLSIGEGHVFKLSQLERLEDLSINSAPDTLNDNTDSFAFEGQSNRYRNQRVIEAVAGLHEDKAAKGSTVNQAGTQTNIETSTQIESLDSPQSPELADQEIADLIAKLAPNSVGSIAFTKQKGSSLSAIARSLNRSSRFDVLSHNSWVQPIDGEPTPVMIQTGKRYDDRFEVEGTLYFSRSRYLHMQTNLWVTQFEPSGFGQSGFGQSGFGQSGFETAETGATANPGTNLINRLSADVLEKYPDLVSIERERGQYFPARSHVMNQTRRLRSNELHYVDHPLFGIVVQINRFKPEPVDDTFAQSE